MLRRRSGTVTVIEERVRRSVIRTAKLGFWITWVIVTLLAANIAAARIHPPLLALMTGMLIGLVAGTVVFVVMALWPVIRALWWWLPEVTVALGLTDGWIELADHTDVYWRVAISAAVAGIPAAIPALRHRILAMAWCLITRHRLRVCFSEFIISNRTGTLPLILWGHPTQVGERIWIWLRPGLAVDDILTQLDKIAVACWAATASAEPAATTNAAFIRLDIKRRDALSATVISPLLGLITGTARRNPPQVADTPAALDLPDVTTADITPVRPAPARSAKPATWPQLPGPAPARTPDSDTADNITDWI